ncbi:hypothetical protein Clacol_008777 [Clathrus columnatus]|uniref:DUF1308 domain-containing protein n=1 Tax=Clathrus columnatus TaxID=1419009 RepID=A0AAV5AN77_9AGAM|nr:hypothetical protein Clacol_008777 [Clathrus columnatus]
MTEQTLPQLLDQLRAIVDGISFISKRGYILPIIGLDNDNGPDSSQNIDSIFGLRNFRVSVNKEIQVLEQHLTKAAQRQQRSNFSTNAPYFIAVWNEILSAPLPIIAIGKTFPFPCSFPPQINDIKRGKKDTNGGGVKVDVVANEGRTWIRVNTIKNSRIMAEFREFDSYLTESEDSEDGESESLLLSSEKVISTVTDKNDFPTEQDNSLLKMRRDLISASSVPLTGTNERPKVVLRLTRLDPSKEQDQRIDQVIADLRQLGLDVQLGERFFRTLLTDEEEKDKYRPSFSSSSSLSVRYKPTKQVSLDLSVLIALVSDLTHAPLPVNNEEARLRFKGGRHDGKPYIHHTKEQEEEENSRKDRSDDIGSLENENENEFFTKHSRALFLQCLQEMDHGIIDEMVQHLSMTWPIETVQFWTTEEARDRCLQIVEKVGGPNEKRRARAMFHKRGKGGEEEEEEELTESESVSAVVEEFWKDSRYPSTFFPSLLPIRIHQRPTTTYTTTAYDQVSQRIMTLFQSRILRTCRYFLQHAPTPHPRLFRKHGEMERAQVSSLNTKLTMHTVESMLIGVLEGMTIITANKASVKTLLREMKDLENKEPDHSSELLQLPSPSLGVEIRDANNDFAVIWVIEPRSLAEEMRETSQL